MPQSHIFRSCVDHKTAAGPILELVWDTVESFSTQSNLLHNDAQCVRKRDKERIASICVYFVHDFHIVFKLRVLVRVELQ